MIARRSRLEANVTRASIFPNVLRILSCLFILHYPTTASIALNHPQNGTAERLSRFTYVEYHMGVDTRLVVYAKDEATAKAACAEAFERIAALDSMMSDYRSNSELMLLCDKAGGPAVQVSPELFLVLERAQTISRLTH